MQENMLGKTTRWPTNAEQHQKNRLSQRDKAAGRQDCDKPVICW